MDRHAGLEGECIARVIERKNFLITGTKPAHGDGAVFRLSLAESKDDRHLDDGMLTHLEADFFVGKVQLAAQSGGGQGLEHLPRIAVVILRDGGDDHLNRGQPQRKGAGIFLDQDTDEPLQ